MVFTNVKRVVIRNKEVQSIVTSTGGVLYEKAPVSGYNLILATNKNSLSYSNNESATLTATLTEDGVGVSGETVNFSSKSSQYVDNCSQNNLSKYSISGFTMTYNNDEYNFTLTHNGGGSGSTGKLYLPLTEFSEFSFEAKILASHVDQNSWFGLVLYSSTKSYNLEFRDTGGHKFFKLTDGSASTVDGAWTTNKYYRAILTLNGTVLSAEVYDDNNNQVFTDSCTLTSEIVSSFSRLELQIIDSYFGAGSMTGSIKDIKVTALNSKYVVENLGNGTTDANGVVTKSFVGEVVGNVTIQAEAMNLQKTVQIQVT